MSVARPSNGELNDFEAILDSMTNLEGSELFSDLENVYLALDSVLTELHDRIDELEKEVEELQND